MTIWKYPLHGGVRAVQMPAGARLLVVGAQPPADISHAAEWGSSSAAVFLWAMVDDSAPVVARRILVGGTGHQYDPAWRDAPYVGTVQLPTGIVVHVFDGGEGE